MIEISKEPGITISKLGNLLLMSPRISRVVKSLSKEGLLEIHVGEDKREKSLRLTNSGVTMVEKIDFFSQTKIQGAFQFLTEENVLKIIDAIEKYSFALEQNRLIKEQIIIKKLSTSRTIRRQIIEMVGSIQKDEFSIPITPSINQCILKAEKEFYYNNSCNFWYAMDGSGKILGSIGLKKIDDTSGEIKKFFVIPFYRGKGVAQKLMATLLKAAVKHSLDHLYLGTVDTLKAAHRFYEKIGFIAINKNKLPKHFKECYLDSVFFKGTVKDLKNI